MTELTGCCLAILLLQLLIGGGLKLYTEKKKSDIDGFRGIAREEECQGTVIGRFGDGAK